MGTAGSRPRRERERDRIMQQQYETDRQQAQQQQQRQYQMQQQQQQYQQQQMQHQYPGQRQQPRLYQVGGPPPMMRPGGMYPGGYVTRVVSREGVTFYTRPPQPERPTAPVPEISEAKTVKNCAILGNNKTVTVTSSEPKNATFSFTVDSTAAGTASLFILCREFLKGDVYQLVADLQCPSQSTSSGSTEEGGVCGVAAAPSKPTVEVPFAAESNQTLTFPDVVIAEGASDLLKMRTWNYESGASNNHVRHHFTIALALWYAADDGVKRAHVTYFNVGPPTEETSVVQLTPVRQTFWTGSELFLLEDIYGLGSEEPSLAAIDVSGDDDGEGHTCVICISEPRDTTIMPCRHMCLCAECADSLRKTSNKCPLCRTTISSLLHLKHQAVAAVVVAPPATNSEAAAAEENKAEADQVNE
ncbi:putative E3 ubiquitin-protein ligase LUL2 [Diplonema papillatum]|nr:putative E3 ubiquitin-protein ligase LUL2 [Diplonema papillatum]